MCVLGRKDTGDGPLRVITPEESGWYRAYVNNFLLDEAELRSSGIGFVCRTSYKDLLHQIKSDNRFERWCGHKWNGKKLSPVELLLLGLLRYLGCDWTLDDIEEQTAISILLSSVALSHRFILLRHNQTWQSTLRRDFLVVSGQQIALTLQRRDVTVQP